MRVFGYASNIGGNGVTPTHNSACISLCLGLIFYQRVSQTECSRYASWENTCLVKRKKGMNDRGAARFVISLDVWRLASNGCLAESGLMKREIIKHGLMNRQIVQMK